MAAVTFDTLKFVEKLKAAGVSDGQAKAEAEALQGVFAGYKHAIKKAGVTGLFYDLRLVFQEARANAFTLAFRRLLWRAALFLWIRPLFTAESMIGCASRKAACACAASPVCTATRTFFTCVRKRLRIAALCSLRCSDWRARFFADAMLANACPLNLVR